ncbi:Hypothetical protein, putative [Bodo saltans]|nr:Hypothetical protein, putative [Bodo saltans]|eukprot:CUI14288.1 Hypothetical protein, putative [Bodo saltans]
MIGSTTANLYDYRAGRGGLISQAWTSSKQYIVSECSLNAVRAMQVGNVIGFLGDWAQGAPDPNNLMWLNFFAFTR